MRTLAGRDHTRFFLINLIVVLFATTVSSQNMFRKLNDFDGDGKSDFVVTRNVGDFQTGIYKYWYIWQSRDGYKVFQWGINGDVVAPGDYDGDGRSDIAIFRPADVPPNVPRFWIWNSGSSSVTQVDFNGIHRVSATMQQDYNGDGRTDAGLLDANVQEPPGSGATTVHTKYSGTNGGGGFIVPPFSIPIRSGDMTGDGRADAAYFTYNINPRVVTIFDSATGNPRYVQFGQPIDAHVFPTDFDGDGIGDLAIWRSSNGDWWYIRSSDNTVRVANWGINGDVPVVGDYDGDGITDLAIWRVVSGQGYYWIYGSQTGVAVFAFGLSTDTLVRP